MKQIIIVRTDLNMGIGKTSVQVAHASVMSALKSSPQAQMQWVTENQRKIVLKVNTLEELVKIYDDAINDYLPAILVIDGGNTVLKPGTITTVGIGPAPDVLIDNITGYLKLL